MTAVAADWNEAWTDPVGLRGFPAPRGPI